MKNRIKKKKEQNRNQQFNLLSDLYKYFYKMATLYKADDINDLGNKYKK